MGTVKRIKCKNCGYDIEAYFGEGMMSSMANHKAMGKVPEYWKNDVEYKIAEPAYDLEAAKNGEYGEDIQKFLQEDTDIYVAKAPAVAICSKCGAIEQTEDFMVYNNDGYVKRKKHFKKCEKCGGDAEIFDEGSIEDAICPKCHEKIDVAFCGIWD